MKKQAATSRRVTLTDDEVRAILTAFRAHVDDETHEDIEDGAGIRRGTVGKLLDRLADCAA